MQEAIPYRTWLQSPASSMTHNDNVTTTTMTTMKTTRNGAMKLTIYDESNGDHLKRMVKENAVIVFAKKGCCLSHVAKGLLQRVGANPTVYEVDEREEEDLVDELQEVDGGRNDQGRLQFPVVFIGGRWFGGLDRIIITHITEELTPLLKQAGALWL